VATIWRHWLYEDRVWSMKYGIRLLQSSKCMIKNWWFLSPCVNVMILTSTCPCSFRDNFVGLGLVCRLHSPHYHWLWHFQFHDLNFGNVLGIYIVLCKQKWWNGNMGRFLLDSFPGHTEHEWGCMGSPVHLNSENVQWKALCWSHVGHFAYVLVDLENSPLTL